MTLNIGYGFVLIELLIFIYCIYRGKIHTFKFFFVITLLQNFILIVFSGQFSSTATTMFILCKEFVVYLGAIWYWVNKRKKKINLVDATFLLFLVLCFVNIVVNKTSGASIVSSLRQFLIPYMCFYFGQMTYKKGYTYDILDKFIVHLMVPVCIISLFLYIPDPTRLWGGLGYSEYTINKTGSAFNNDSIANFYTYDFGPRLKRMVSVIADPLAFSHLIVVAILLFTLLNKNKRHSWWELLFLLCGVLCLSKYHVIVLLIYVFWKLYANTRDIGNKFIYNTGFIAIVVAIFSWLIKYTGNLTENTAIGNHFGSFINGFKSISLLGNGLGTTGYNALLYGGLNVEENSVNESFFATMLSQMGIIGTVVYYFGLLVICWNQYHYYKQTKDKHFFVNLVLVSSILIETLVSASSVSMLGSGLFLILAGYYEKMKIILNKRIYNENYQ